MIEIHHFNDAYQHYQQHKISLRLLQDQAFIILSTCENNPCSATNSLEITQSDIDLLIQLPEAIFDYNQYLGGNIYICDTAQDLMQIQGCDFDWAEKHYGMWPNVTDMPLVWDDCRFVDESSGDPQWVMFLMCWNNAGGASYYVPKHLWKLARVTEHMAATNPNPSS